MVIVVLTFNIIYCSVSIVVGASGGGLKWWWVVVVVDCSDVVW